MKKLRYSAILLVLILLGYSCNQDLLDIDNPNEATTVSFWKTQTDAIAGVNA